MTNKAYPDAPRVAVGAVVLHQGQVLLVLRGQAPSKDMWAIPGGRVELGETIKSAAEREVLEETGLQVIAGEVTYTFDVIDRDPEGRIRYHYVILDLLAEPIDPTQPLAAADDARDVRWFTLDEINELTLPISVPTRKLLNRLMRDGDAPPG
jgi:ADP-ribose pyrophosphatase